MALRLSGLARAVCTAAILSWCGQASLASSKVAQGGLQLNVIAPDPATIGDRLSLDVSYRGGAVSAVEVYLDGALVAKRQLAGAQTHGVMTFVLETMLLTEGDHEVVIKAFGTDGRAVTVPAKVRIPGPDLSAPVRIAYPLNGIEVSGTVPVRVKLDSELQRQRPYVTFFINKELKALRNYPPYEYNWDTTAYPNGWHSVEAWTQSPDMAAPYKSRPVYVNVNNSGGLTQRQKVVEDLRTEKPQPSAQPPAGEVSRPAAKPAAAPTTKPAAKPRGEPTRSVVLAPEPSSGQVGVAFGPARSGVQATSVGTMRTAEPTSTAGAQRAIPAVPAPRVASVPEKLPRVAASLSGPRVTEPHYRARSAAKPQEPATVTTTKGETLADVSRRIGVRPQEIARINNVKAADSEPLPTGQKLVIPSIGTFDVAYDGVVIAFDVVPRVDRGVGVAPIRQIFEHTGGRLYWFGSAKTVRAVNDTREIELRIGKTSALVNNQILTLERAPFIESGRTLVPLTFLRDALSVSATFDAATGRVLLRSK